MPLSLGTLLTSVATSGSYSTFPKSVQFIVRDNYMSTIPTASGMRSSGDIRFTGGIGLE